MDTTLPVFDKYYLTGNIFKPGVDVRQFAEEMDARRQADASRRRAMAERIQLWRDDSFQIVRRKIQQEFEIENTVEIFKVLDVSNNLLKRIISSISTIYDSPARHELDKDDGGAWNEIRETAHLDLVMPQVNQLVNLCNECFVRVAVHRGQVEYQVITPDNLMVDRNRKHPERIDGVWIWVGGGPSWDAGAKTYATQSEKGFWHYWNRDPDNPAHHVFDEQFQVVDDAFGVDGVNPYEDQDGRPTIPGVMFHRALPIGSVWDTTSGQDLVDGSAMLMAMASLVNHLFRVDSAMIKWVSGDPDLESMDGQTVGALRMLVIRAMQGERVQVGQFRSQADWKGLLEVIADKGENLVSSHGLSLGMRDNQGNPSSGFALKVRREPLLEIRRRQLPLYRLYDNRLYAATAAVWNYERTRAESEDQAGMPADGKPLLWPRDAKLKITYSDYQVPLTAAEEEASLSATQVRLSMGLANIVEEYMKGHPEVTRDEAEKAIQANQKINAKYLPGVELVLGRGQVLPLDVAGAAKPGTAASPGKPASVSPINPAAGAGPTAQPAKPKGF